MSEFSLYFNLGMEHILDIEGYDHILFVIALCSVYLLRDWKKVLILITAFTVGHSLTLALAVFNIVSVDADLIEFLIPVTIFITAFYNMIRKPGSAAGENAYISYFFALFFGLIHGLGFSNYLRAILGRDKSIVNQLLAFNLGLEVGQIIIVAVFLFFSFIFISLFRVSRRDWVLVISSAVAGVSLMLMLEAKFW